VGNFIAHSGNHHSAVAVPDENHFLEMLIFQHIHNIVDVRVQIDGWVGKVRALAKASKCWRKHLVSSRTQERSHTLPAPTTMPRAMYKSIRCHKFLLSRLGP